jgi:hypothetical protein
MMPIVRFVRALRLLLLLGLAGCVLGCGSAAPQASPADLEAAGKAIAEAQQRSHAEAKESKKAQDAASNASRRGFRPPGQ